MGCEKCKHLEPETKYCTKQDRIILNGQMKFGCLEFEEGEFQGPERIKMPDLQGYELERKLLSGHTPVEVLTPINDINIKNGTITYRLPGIKA